MNSIDRAKFPLLPSFLHSLKILFDFINLDLDFEQTHSTYRLHTLNRLVLTPTHRLLKKNLARMALFPAASKQFTTPAPTRSAREACWEHRDVYFGCLDKESVAVPGQEDKDGKCAKEREIYGKECAASWVCCLVPMSSSVVCGDVQEWSRRVEHEMESSSLTFGRRRLAPTG